MQTSSKALFTLLALFQTVQHLKYPQVFNFLQKGSNQLNNHPEILLRLVMSTLDVAPFAENFWIVADNPKIPLASVLSRFLLPSNPSSVLCSALVLVSCTVNKGVQALDAFLRLVTQHPEAFDFVALLEHADGTVRARCCRTIGNLMSPSDAFYAEMRKRNLLIPLIHCLKDSDQQVRMAAAFAIGNAAFHSDALYGRLGAAIAPLVSFLADSLPVNVKCNAACALGNFLLHSAKLWPRLKKEKCIERLLDIAMGDSPKTCQLAALQSLRIASMRKECIQHLVELRARRRLEAHTGGLRERVHGAAVKRRPQTVAGRGSQIQAAIGHCSRLIRSLTAAERNRMSPPS
eukprot:m.156277 g.156277  ORF g.156277 m.156277 type:complete len:347 (+) comp38688_c0_seq35:4145-5185(+)